MSPPSKLLELGMVLGPQTQEAPTFSPWGWSHLGLCQRGRWAEWLWGMTMLSTRHINTFWTVSIIATVNGFHRHVETCNQSFLTHYKGNKDMYHNWRSKEIKPVNPKGNQSWIFIGRTDAEVEAPVPWPPDTVRQLWKRPCCWERLKTKGEGGCREWDDRWHHQLNGHKFEQIPGDGGGQRNLACYSPCDYKKWDTISQFNSNNDDTHDSKPSLL